MADDINIGDVACVVVDGVAQLAQDVKQIINNPEQIKEQLIEQIRINHCKDLTGKLDAGGKPITQEQIEQCIAFVEGNYSIVAVTHNEPDKSRSLVNNLA